MVTDMARRRRIHTFSHDGLTFDVRDTGPLDGPPVVLLHGFPQTSTSWDKVSELLHGDGYRTIAPDLRGYSPGARPSGRRAYATELLAEDVAALLAVVGEPVHLVGHDWGSAIGWVVAARHPDRLLSWTAVSVPHPAAFVASMARSTQLLKSWYMGFFQLPVVPELVLARARGVRERVLRHAGMDRDLLARFHAEGEVPTAGAVVAVDESEDAEYAALVEAAEVSAGMSGGGRRVVVVAEVPHEGAVAPMRDVASVHVDTEDGADPDDELAWFATQEVPHLLE